ncbi:MAG TPA: type II toxin-antitoxin system VapC family toxin [Thermoanaerobaculia bacterium]|nr:type II toxin-antitoxin system VapC family toxin [Thermoanaerobaculia bacterium]
MKPRVYVETTIVSYLAARPSRDLIVAAHQQLTAEWWTSRRLSFDLFTSEFVLREASVGDEDMARKRLELLMGIPVLSITESALGLASALIDKKAVPQRYAEDASHISMATVHGLDYLMTWNCKHIANAQLQRSIGVICRNAGYEPPIICTPEELMGV